MKSNAFSLLSSSVAIWVANVLTSLCYTGKSIGAARTLAPASCEQSRIGSFRKRQHPRMCRPTRHIVLDYLFLGYNTATAFSPTDVLPLTRRAKMLMMLESTISLLTLVIVVSRAINVLP